jgi:hypothetical protein
MTLTLNRPERLNAFNVALHEALFAAIERAGADPNCRAVLLTGAGKGSSAGQDLTDRVVASDGSRPDLGLSLEKSYNPLIRARFAGCPNRSSAPSIAQRPALGSMWRSRATSCLRRNRPNSCKPSRTLA